MPSILFLAIIATATIASSHGLAMTNQLKILRHIDCVCHATSADDIHPRFPRQTESNAEEHDRGSLVNRQPESQPWLALARRDAFAGTFATLLGASILPQSFPTTIPSDPMAALQTGDELVRNLWLGRLAYPTLIVALETGLFEALKHGSLPMGQVGKSLKRPLPGSSRALEAIVSVLMSLGLLRKAEFHGHIELTDPARMVLLKDASHFWGPQLLAADGTTASLRRAIEVESVTPDLSTKVPYASHSDAAVDSFIESMQAHSSVTAEATAVALDNVIGESAVLPAHHVLDMAGGSGCFATALCQRYPNIHVTLADLPSVIKTWKRKNNKKMKVVATAADLFDVETWPLGVDVILLANVLHDWSEEKNLEILRAGYSTLTDKARPADTGRIIVVEQLTNDDRSGPLPATLASISMLLGDWRSGKQYSYLDLETLLYKAGFEHVELGPRCGPFHQAVVASVH